jgi:hypothetical protein
MYTDTVNSIETVTSDKPSSNQPEEEHIENSSEEEDTSEEEEINETIKAIYPKKSKQE